MAKLIAPFDATQFNPQQSSGSLPIGKHPVVIDSSEVKANKAGDGGYLQLTLKIIDGPSKGSTGPYRLNLYSASQQAVDIANKQLSAICHVLNVFQFEDSQALHNVPFVVEVGPQKDNPQYTEVKRVYDINGNEPGQAPVGGAQPQQPAQPAQSQQAQGAWGGQQQQAPAQEQQQAAAWNAGQQQQPTPQEQAQQAQQANAGSGQSWGAPAGQQAPAWGQGQQQAPAQQQSAQGGWQQQQGGAPANAPWGAK